MQNKKVHYIKFTKQTTEVIHHTYMICLCRHCACDRDVLKFVPLKAGLSPTALQLACAELCWQCNINTTPTLLYQTVSQYHDAILRTEFVETCTVWVDKPSQKYFHDKYAKCVAVQVTHSRILSGIQRAAQTVLGIYLKHTCSRVTSASSALAVLNGYVL